MDEVIMHLHLELTIAVTLTNQLKLLVILQPLIFLHQEIAISTVVTSESEQRVPTAYLISVEHYHWRQSGQRNELQIPLLSLLFELVKIILIMDGFHGFITLLLQMRVMI